MSPYVVQTCPSLAVHEINQSIRTTDVSASLLSYILHEGLPGETCVPTTIHSCNVPHSLKFKSGNFFIRYFVLIVTQFFDIVWNATMHGNSGSVMKRPPDSKPRPSWDFLLARIRNIVDIRLCLKLPGLPPTVRQEPVGCGGPPCTVRHFRRSQTERGKSTTTTLDVVRK